MQFLQGHCWWRQWPWPSHFKRRRQMSFIVPLVLFFRIFDERVILRQSQISVTFWRSWTSVHTSAFPFFEGFWSPCNFRRFRNSINSPVFPLFLLYWSILVLSDIISWGLRTRQFSSYIVIEMSSLRMFWFVNWQRACIFLISSRAYIRHVQESFFKLGLRTASVS